jgi:hypothetical protein
VAEVRTGLVRPLTEIDRTYIGRMASYPEICAQLFKAACGQGLTPHTRVIAPGDGGNGLREELEVHFIKFQYILDHRHLESHFYKTAEALGVEAALRAAWVKTQMEHLWKDEVDTVLTHFKAQYEETSNDRLRRLLEYLTRFADAVDYGRFKANGGPIGSGEVESAHRYVPQERLNIPGACWHPETVNPMLALRVIRANDWWNDFWEWLYTQRQQEKRAA